MVGSFDNLILYEAILINQLVLIRVVLYKIKILPTFKSFPCSLDKKSVNTKSQLPQK